MYKVKYIGKIIIILFLSAVEKKNYNLAFEISEYFSKGSSNSTTSINLSVTTFLV